MNVTEATAAWESAKDRRDIARQAAAWSESGPAKSALRFAETQEQKAYDAYTAARKAASIAHRAWDEAERRADSAKADALTSYLDWCELIGITQD